MKSPAPTPAIQSVGVVGAGPAGLTAAYELAKRGIGVEVFEAQSSVGGMARSFALWGQIVDLGPHRFFSTDPRVNRIWLEIADGRYDMVDRLTRIYYNETFFDYPLRAFNALAGLGPVEALRCLASYARAVASPLADDTSFENWVVNRFGRRLFEIFFKSYSEKLWGISCQALDADFAAQRIKKFSLREAIKSALAPGRSNHKTLVDQFAYPTEGTGFIYERMAQRIEALGGRIHRDTRVTEVDVAGARPALTIGDGTIRTFDHIVSSMPITSLVERMDPPDAVRANLAHLTFRNTILVYLEIEGQELFPDQWIYVHAANLKTGRITNFRNWLPSLCGSSPNTILCLEYWCYDEDAIWRAPQDELVALATEEIRATGLIGQRAVRNGRTLKLPKCYPVYARGYRTQLAPVETFLSGFDRLSVIGRYGAFKYNNQDHSILMGLLAAENIAGGASHDLWAINTDYEYQEASLITKTGLVAR